VKASEHANRDPKLFFSQWLPWFAHVLRLFLLWGTRQSLTEQLGCGRRVQSRRRGYQFDRRNAAQGHARNPCEHKESAGSGMD